MNAADHDTPSALDHVLVLAPYRQDADYLRQLLTEHDIAVDHCRGDAWIAPCLATGPGVFVTTHEALNPKVIETVAAHLHAQPAWSEMPIVVLLDRASPNARIRRTLEAAWPRSRQLYYQRPLSPIELVSGIQSALLARLRQRDVRDHIDREIDLRHELNHRVKNILASVVSIFEMTRHRASSLDGLAEDFGARLNALAKVHSAVFQGTGESISMAEIVELTFAPYRLTAGNRIEAAGPRVILSGSAGTSLALCLHELTTNAMKYGALSQPEGRVRFRWKVVGRGAPDLEIAWQEIGGPEVIAPTRTGYGTRYLRAALTSLFGRPPELSFRRSGLRCTARGPLDRLTWSEPAPAATPDDPRGPRAARRRGAPTA